MPLLDSSYEWKAHAKKVFLREKSVDLTGAQLFEKLNRTVGILRRFDVKTLLICGRNSTGWLLFYLAAKKLQISTIIVSPDFSGKKLKQIIANTGCDAAFFGDITIKPESEHAVEVVFDVGLSTHKFLSFKETKVKLPHQDVDVLYTSGTTGAPKGVMVPIESSVNTANVLIHELGMHAEHSELLSMPFYHSFGLARLRASVMACCTLVVSDGLRNAPKVISEILAGHINGLGLVPTGLELFKQLSKSKAAEIGSRVEYLEIGSSSMSHELRVWLKKYFVNTRILHHYGMTEASRSFFVPRGAKDDFEKPDTVGYAAPNVEYEIRNRLGSGEGELFLRGPNLALGYLGDRQLTKEKFREGWFATGDLVIESGNSLKLIGRTDSTINVGGEKISALEVESVIEQLEGVECATCFPIEDRILGFRLAVIVQLISSTDSDLNKVRLEITKAFVNPFFKLTASRISFVENIPKTPNGKKTRIIQEIRTAFDQGFRI
ncbi:acyl--CoA ligase [Gammaproteobacteria bacterium]|nr:acyl--CoA ligase [Gammaproteobacteria bacterium]